MRRSFALPALLVLSSASSTLAFNGLDVPSTIAANITSKLQISNDLSKGSGSFDGQFSSFRTYLSITVPGYGAGPACYLANSTAINTTSLSFLVPPSVGPDGEAYSLATMEFNQNTYASGPSGYEYSNEFILTNATGAWSAAELAGQTIADPDNLPCSAYNCARNCTQTFYPLNANETSAYRQTYECTAACPGATYESWAALLEEDCKAQSSAGPLGSSVVCAAASSASVSATMTHSSTATSTSSSTFSATSSTATPTGSASAGSQISGIQVTLISTIFATVLTAFNV